MNLFSRIKRTAFSWIGANPSAERKLTPSTNANHPETSSNQRGRIQLIWEARDLQKNHPLVAGILKRLTLYTLGTIRYQARSNNPDFNTAAETYFSNWSKTADLAGRFDFTGLIQLAFSSFLRDGDCLIVTSINKTGVRLQLIEADRIGNPYAAGISDSEIGGISIDNTGRPTSFCVYRRSMGSAYVDPIEIPASRCLHLIDPERHDSYRGISAFAPAIATCRDVIDILEGEKAAVKWAAGQSGMIRTQSGNGQGWTETTSSGEQIERIKPGTIHYLRPGEEVQSFRNERPSVTFSGFLESLQRHIADALGLPYGFFIDSSKLGGVTARLDSQQAARVARRYQDIITRRLLDPIAEAVIAFGIADGQIPDTPDWNTHRWQFPPWPSTDIGRDTKAALEEIIAGGATWAEYYAEKGEDWEEAFQQSAIETARRKTIFAEAGVKDPVIAAAAIKPGAQPAAQPAAFAAPDSYDPPQNVQAAAARALRERDKKPPSQRGMTPVGLARARDLSNGRPVSIETLRRMKAYFDRHEVDKKGSTWDDYGKGRQAWDGWGGDAGRAWANRILESLA